MKFAILKKGFEVNEWIAKKANLLAVSEDVKDETLDTATLEVLADESDKPYEARSLCYIEDGGKKAYYRLASDSVSVFSYEPLTYKHSVSLVQCTRDLSHAILPNMVITKPREKERTAYFACANRLNFDHYTDPGGHGGDNFYQGFISCGCMPEGSLTSPGSWYWQEPIALTDNNKIGSLRIFVEFKAIRFYFDNSGDHARMENLSSLPEAPSWFSPYVAIYVGDTRVARYRLDRQSSTQWNDKGLTIPIPQSVVDTINTGSNGKSLYVRIETDLGSSAPHYFATNPWNGDRLFYNGTYDSSDVQEVFAHASLIATRASESLYSTIQRMLYRQRCAFDDSSEGYLFYLPTSGDDYDLLMNTETPEFSFVGQTMYEALTQVLATVDALPDFEVFESGTTHQTSYRLKLDFLNSRGKKIANANVGGYTAGTSESKYVNGMVTEYQRAEKAKKFPGGDKYARCSLKSYGVPELVDFALAFDKPIKYVNSLEISVDCSCGGIRYAGSGSAYTFVSATLRIPVDIASFVFDSATYSSALSDRGSYPTANSVNFRLQMNCLKFAKGSRFVDLGNKVVDEYNKTYLTFWNCLYAAFYRFQGTFGTNYISNLNPYGVLRLNAPKTSEYKDVYFRAEYVTDLEGRLRIESPKAKSDGAMSVSSGGGSIDLGKLGLNMMGVSMRTGVPTMTMGQRICSWESRIRKGDVFEKDGYKWIANKCDYQRLGADMIRGTIQFTRDYNGMSRRIAVDQSKRYTEISPSVVNKCEVNPMAYCMMKLNKTIASPFVDYHSNFLDTPINMPNLMRLLGKPFGRAWDGTAVANVDFARYYVEPGSSGIRDIYMPLAVYASGNCLCFEASFKDAISAGVAMDVSDSGDGTWWNALQQATGTSKYFGKDVKYADSEGYADTMSIDYVVGDGARFPDTFPHIPNSGSNKVGTLRDLKFHKMPNEIVAVNHEIAFVDISDEGEIFLGKPFMEAMANDADASRTLYVWTSYDEYTMMDTKRKADAKGGSSAFKAKMMLDGSEPYEHGAIGFDCYIQPYDPSISSDGWHSLAIADEDGNIYLAMNCKFKTKDEIPYLCLLTSTERLQ